MQLTHAGGICAFEEETGYAGRFPDSVPLFLHLSSLESIVEEFQEFIRLCVVNASLDSPLSAT